MINAPPEDVPVLLLRSTRFAFIQVQGKGAEAVCRCMYVHGRVLV